MERIDEACHYREKFGQKNVVQVVLTLGTGIFLFEITAVKLLCKGSIVRSGKKIITTGKNTTFFKDANKKYGKIS